MIVGVNGSGKTTTTGKLCHRLRHEGLSVVLAAADTYRDAAAEQLAVWAQRAEVELVSSVQGQDAAAVAFDAVSRAVSRGDDVVIVDTAGRLHTRADLMQEAGKIKRVRAGSGPARRTISGWCSMPPSARTGCDRPRRSTGNSA